MTPAASDDAGVLLRFLARLAGEFTVVLDVAKLMDLIMLLLREEAGLESCDLSLIEGTPPDEVLRIRAASGLRRRWQGFVFPRGGGAAWIVIDTAAPLLISNMANDPRVAPRSPDVRSGIFVPLVVQDRPIGVLAAFRTQAGALTDTDLQLMTSVARYVAGPIAVASHHDRLKDQAATDPLTGLANRRAFLERLASEIAQCRRSAGALSMVLLDLDGFKAVNDAHGHVVGDGVLAHVALSLTRNIRRSDLMARYGGDEFAILLPGTPPARAEQVLNRLRALDLLPPSCRGSASALCFSWGLATWPNDGESPERLLHVADGRLYAMKRRSQDIGGATTPAPAR